jgi:hypothetical protein
MIFSIPKLVAETIFPEDMQLEQHWAYVEWFKPFSSAPESHYRMYSKGQNCCITIEFWID